MSYLFLLAFAVPGFILAYRRRVLDPIVPLVYGAYLLFYVPVIVLPRYRIVPVLLLLLVASYAAAALFEWWQRRRVPDRLTSRT